MKKNNSSIIFLITALFIPLLLVGGYKVYQTQFQKLPVLGPYDIVKGQKVLKPTPEWTFTDQNNEQFSTDELENKIVVFNFFFTSCPTICPTMNKNVQKIQQVFLTDDTVEFVSISVDPERDVPSRLKEYADAFSLNQDQWHFLTGNKEEIYKLAWKGYNLSATDADGGSANIIHSQEVLLIDNKNQIRGRYDGTEADEMSNLVKDITKLKQELKREL